jgi:hypothetical protein
MLWNIQCFDPSLSNVKAKAGAPNAVPDLRDDGRGAPRF